MKQFCLVLCSILLATSAQSISLDECYSLARKNYPLIRQYDLVNQTTHYSFENASKGYLPQIAFLGQATIQNEVSEFPSKMNSAYELMGVNFKGLSKDQYKLMLQVSQTIWDGGITKAKKESIEAEACALQLSLDKDLDAIKSRVNQIYFGILILESNLKLNSFIDTLLQNNLKMIESGVNNGVALQSDMDNVNVELLSIRQQHIELKESIEAYRKILSIMIGKELLPTEPLERPSIVNITDQNNRTELKLFQAQTSTIGAQRSLTNASIYPHIDLFAQGWYGKPGLNIFNDMQNNKFSWNALVGVRIQWNISNLYSHRNNLNKLLISEESINVQKETFLWNIDLKRSELEGEIEKMQKLHVNDAEIVALRKSIRKSSESKYQNGIITITELLGNITNENKAIQNQLRHELEMLKSIYDLKITLNQ